MGYDTGDIKTVGDLRQAVFLRRPEQATHVHDAVSMVLSGLSDTTLEDAREQYMRGADGSLSSSKWRIRNRAPVDSGMSPELVERMVQLVRDLAGPRPNISALDASEEARSIDALLPPAPVDPLLVRARKICADEVKKIGGATDDFSRGAYDKTPMMQATLRALSDSHDE